MPKPLAIVTEALDAEPLAWLAERCEVIHAEPGSGPFNERLSQASALIVRTYTIVDDALLDRAPSLKVVARAGVALDNIDVAACRCRGIEVVHTPGSNSSAVAEYVFAMIFDAVRPRLFLDAPVDLDRWNEVRGELLARRQLEEMTMGVWGCGRIGTRVCRIARAFNMRAIYHDILDIDPASAGGAEPVDRDTLLAEADVVTVHIDDRPANRNIVNTDAFGRMKSDVIFISAARGLIVDPVAAADFLIAHPGATGIFDVHEPEPFDETYPLLDIKNAHLAPHIAAATELAKRNMSWVVRDAWRVLNGEDPLHRAPAEAETSKN